MERRDQVRAPGSRLRRLLAFVIDWWINVGVTAVIASAVHARWYLFGTSFAFGLLYYTASESSGWMATPGKRLMGLRVMRIDGHRLNFARALCRYLGKFASGAFFLLGYALILVRSDRRALHDLCADSIVVQWVRPSQPQAVLAT